MEAKADIVSDPVAIGIAEDGFEQSCSFGDGFGAVDRGETVENSVAEGVEPVLHAARERCGARDEFDGLDGEAGGFEQATVDGWRGVVGFSCCFGVNAVGGEDGLERGADGGYVGVTAHFGYKASLRFEGAVDGGEGRGLIGSGYPVKGSVGEDGVELVLVRQVFDAVVVDAEATGDAAGARGGDHVGRGVDACEDGSGGGKLFGERSVAAAYVEDVFSGLSGQEIDDSGGQGGDKAAIGGVGGSAPGLTDRGWPLYKLAWLGIHWRTHLAIVRVDE